MKILVTGSNGFIGQNMVAALQTAGHQVFTFEWGEEWLTWDLDWVIHLGAISETTEQNVDKIMTQNHDFTINLIGKCEDLGINIQYASSAAVYGNESNFKESAELHPSSPYAWSKYMVDRYVLQRSWNVKVQGFRYFNVYGPHEEHKIQPSPFTVFRKQAKETGVIKLFRGSDAMLRDFVHVDKLIEIQQSFFNIEDSGLWNVGSGTPRSFLSVAQEIAEEVKGCKIEEIQMPIELLKSYQYYTCADMTRLNATLSGVL